MTFIGQHLPELVPFMEDTYTPQAVNQARNAFKKKVRKSSATFFYGAMCGFFTTDELDDLLFEASEVARFLLEVEGTTLDIDEEIDIEDRITRVMRSVGEAAKTLLNNRGNEGAVTDQTESTNPSAVAPGREIPQQGFSNQPADGETPGIFAAPANPDLIRPETMSPEKTVPAAETNLHDVPPPGDDLSFSNSGEKQIKDEPVHHTGNSQENTENQPQHPGNTGHEDEDI